MPKKTGNKNKASNNKSEVVYVNSYTYGTHTRAARGSKSPVTVNDVLAAQAGKTSALNAAAKAVYDVLKLYSKGFREGQLWQGILSRMRKANSLQFDTLLQTLDGLELNSRYALARFGNVPVFAVEISKKEMRLEMKPFMPPDLNKKDNCYCYSLIVLLFNSKGVCVQHAKLSTEWIDIKNTLKKKVFSFQKPASAKHWLLCLALDGGIDGVATDTLASKGMRLLYNQK